MSDSDTQTEWTPEMREIHEGKRESARHAIAGFVKMDADAPVIVAYVDQILPPPPPEYTYGRVLEHGTGFLPERRRSDGEWQWSYLCGWRKGTLTDAIVRRRAAEVPLSDAECEYLLNVRPIMARESLASTREAMRLAYARIMRGEVTG